MGRYDGSFSSTVSHQREVAELKRVITELDRSREREEIKADHAMQELNKLRDVLNHKERELKAALIRVDSVAPKKKLVRKKKKSLFVDSSKTSPVNASLARSPVHSLKEGYSFSQSSGRRSSANNNKLEALENECSHLRETIACQEEDLHAAANEIEVLAAALEERAEDLGMDGESMKSGLLYQVGLFKKETHRLELELSKRSKSETEVRTQLEVVNSKVAELGQALEDSQTQVKDLLEEREVILEYIRESSLKTGQLQEKVKDLIREKELKTKSLKKAQLALDVERETRKELEHELVLAKKVQISHKARAQEELQQHLVGDPLFEKMLRETEAEIENTSLLSANSKLKEQVEILSEKLHELENKLYTQDEELMSKEQAMRSHNLQAERNESRLLQQIDELQSKLRRLEEDANTSITTEHPTKPQQASDEEKDVQFKNERLTRLLKIANEAREFAENEAIRLEAENSKLKQQLRSATNK